MNELIWFSIPGAVLLCAIGLLFPSLRSTADALIIAAAPVSGFVFHQFYRTFFEWSGGWESTRRPVLNAIRTAYTIPASNRHRAFLIWEVTFYSESIPDSFREHVRGAWHYIMSFRSIFWASVVATVGLIVVPLFGVGASQSWLHVAAFAILAGLFYAKAHLTESSLGRQEAAWFQQYRSHFDTTEKSIA